MSEPVRVKFLFINMALPNYKLLQIVLVIFWIAVGVASLVLLQDSKHWFLANLWWISFAGAAIEALEAIVAIRKATSGHNDQTQE